MVSRLERAFEGRESYADVAQYASKPGHELSVLFLFPPTGGLQGQQSQGRLGQHDAFIVLVELLPGPDFTLGAAAADADIVGKFANANARVFG